MLMAGIEIICNNYVKSANQGLFYKGGIKMALVYPKQTDEYDVDVFNNNFKELKANIDTNNINTANNLALKASTEYVDEALAGKADMAHTHSLNENSVNGVLPRTKGGTGTNSPDIFDGCLLMGDTDFFCTSLQKPTAKSYLATNNTHAPTWEIPDTVPTKDSTKLITSGTVYNAFSFLNNILYVKADDTPAEIVEKLKFAGVGIYSSLASAISIAYEGYEIVLLPGTYTVSSALTITKSGITIRGLNSALRDKTIINTSVVNAVRLYNSNYILFKDLSFTNIGTTYDRQSIALYSSNHITFENIYLTNTLMFLGYSAPSGDTTTTTYEDICILNCKFGTGAGLNFYSNKLLNAIILNNYFLSGNNFYLYSQECIDNSFISGNNVGVAAIH